MNKSKLHGLAVFIVALLSCWLLSSCKEYYRNKSYASVPESSIRAGEELAKIHCQSCHEFPEPSLLDVTSWELGVLPQMGPRLGVFKHNFKYYPSFKSDPSLDSNYYPSQPLVDAREWQSILDYYLATSPDTLPPQNRPPIKNKSLPGFAVMRTRFQMDSAAIAFIKIIRQKEKQALIFNDVLSQKLFNIGPELLTDLDLKQSQIPTQIQLAPLEPVGSGKTTGFAGLPFYSVPTAGNIVDVEFDGNKYIVCDIGQLNPTNARVGVISSGQGDTIRYDSAHVVPVARKLARPVSLAKGDLNLDKRADYVVCEFGNLTGALSWLEDKGNGKFERHVLSTVPGVIKAQIIDHNKDGLPDVWALFTQGSEGISIFTNLGKGRFHQEKVLSFPSVYGSSYFELADFNKDGYQDIVYTCGDNADYSMVLKPYHGVYIYINDGRNNFSQKYFFAIHGCFKAMARDFDKDGDLDLATISFFADYTNQPEEGFVYLENKGAAINDKLMFEPYTFAESQLGRWLTMDVGDLDGDGSADIVLGNFSMRPSETRPSKDWKKGPPFLVLRNLN